MQAEDAAPCRHPGAPRDDVVDRVAQLMIRLGADPAYLATQGLTTEEYQSALPAAIERFRGSRAASNASRRNFLKSVFLALRTRGVLTQVEAPKYGADTVYRLAAPGMADVAVIQKGCPDGAHSSVRWSRPDWASEAYLWWVCTSNGSEPGEHVWKGVNRLKQRFFSEAPDTIDGVIFSSGLCGTPERPCPKAAFSLEVDDVAVPLPCIYVMPERGEGPDWNWTGDRGLRFPAILLSGFGIAPERAAAFIGHVGFQRRISDVRATITARFGPGQSTTFRS